MKHSIDNFITTFTKLKQLWRIVLHYLISIRFDCSCKSLASMLRKLNKLKAVFLESLNVVNSGAQEFRSKRRKKKTDEIKRWLFVTSRHPQKPREGSLEGGRTHLSYFFLLLASMCFTFWYLVLYFFISSSTKAITSNLWNSNSQVHKLVIRLPYSSSNFQAFEGPPLK